MEHLISLKEWSPEKIRAVLDLAKDVKAGKVKTVNGSELTLGTMGGVTVDMAKVIKADIVADNSVIHVVDSVLLPK